MARSPLKSRLGGARPLIGAATIVLAASGLAVPSTAQALTRPEATTVKVAAGPVAAAGLPTPTVKPSEVTAGAIVTISGVKCFTNSGPAQAFVSMVDPSGSAVASGGVPPKETGAWEIQLTVPSSAKAGSYDIDSTCDQYNSQLFYPRATLVVDAAAKTWATQKNPNRLAPNGTFNAVSCRATSACVGVGHYIDSSGDRVALADAWNGSTWSALPSVSPTGGSLVEMNGVSCTAASCTAVGYYKNKIANQVALAAAWDGTAWSVQAAANPTGGAAIQLSAVSCTSSTACTAVGNYFSSARGFVTLAETWNGTKWKVQTTPSPNSAISSELKSVSCTAATACTAVGDYTNASYLQVPLAEAWNGSVWSIQSVPGSGPNGATLNSVSCTPASCTAVGYAFNSDFGQKPLAEVWNGTTWSVQTTPSPNDGFGSVLSGVSCTRPTACTAVGADSAFVGQLPLAEVWNGVKWAIQTIPATPDAPNGALSSVSCAAASTCAAVGSLENTSFEQLPLAEARSGSVWSAQATPNPTGAVSSLLTSVSCRAATACVAVGEYSDSGTGAPIALAQAWNGTKWSVQTLHVPGGATSSYLSSVSCSAPTACTAVGYYQKHNGDQVPLIEAWNGSTWTTQLAPLPAGARFGYLNSVSCTAANRCTAVGDYDNDTFFELLPLAEVWNGSTWSLQSTPVPPGASEGVLNAVSCATSTSCIAVGTFENSAFQILQLGEVWNGSTWSAQSIPGPTGSTGSQLNGVSCTTSTACVAVGSYFNSGFQTVTLVEAWNGSKWVVQLSANGGRGGTLYGVSCTAATACTAVGAGYYFGPTSPAALAEVWNGASWAAQATAFPGGPATSSLTAVSCISATACAAVGAQNLATQVPLVEAEGGA